MEIRKIAGWAAAAATAFSLLYQFPAKASGPLISGLQEPGEAEGPALAGNEEEEIKTVTASISEENLNDGLIEYEELESLIRTGNSSAVNSQKSYETRLEVYQAAYDSLVSAKRDMLNKADELEDEGADAALIESYEQNAQILSSSAAQMKRSINSLNSATNQASLQSARDSADKLKRQLAILIGRDAETVQIGEIPAVTSRELEQMNLESDKAKAVIADPEVKSIKKSTATGDTARKLRRQQLYEAEGAAGLTMDELYRAVIEAQQLYEGAGASYAAAEKDYGAVKTKYGAGMINKSTWLSGEAEWYSAAAAYKSAEIAYKQAVASYQWAIKGIS